MGRLGETQQIKFFQNSQTGLLRTWLKSPLQGGGLGWGLVYMENKVHQKTVLVQFGLVNFRPFKIGKNWIASGFRPRNDEKDFLPKRTIKYKNTCCKLTLGLGKKNSEFDSKNFSSEVLQHNIRQGNAVNENNRY